MKNYYKLVGFLGGVVSLGGVFVSATTVQAVWNQYPTFSDPPRGNAPITSVNDSLNIIVNIIDFAQVAFFILAAGFGLYGAYLYLFSQGNKESVTQAKNMFIYMAVAIFVAIIAYGIPSIVVNFVDISIS